MCEVFEVKIDYRWFIKIRKFDKLSRNYNYLVFFSAFKKLPHELVILKRQF